MKKDGQTFTGNQAVFSLKGLGVESLLVHFCPVGSDWILKVRATYPEKVASQREVARFFEALPETFK